MHCSYNPSLQFSWPCNSHYVSSHNSQRGFQLSQQSSPHHHDVQQCEYVYFRKILIVIASLTPTAHEILCLPLIHLNTVRLNVIGSERNKGVLQNEFQLTQLISMERLSEDEIYMSTLRAGCPSYQSSVKWGMTSFIVNEVKTQQKERCYM